MKAAIVKNDDFETVGLEITEGKTVFFSWGISPRSPFFYVKNADVESQLAFNIIKMGVLVAEYSHEVDRIISNTITESGFDHFNTKVTEAKKAKLNHELNKLINSVK